MTVAQLGTMGYRYQFITLAGFHALNASMFELARGYAEERGTLWTAEGRPVGRIRRVS